jgi:hypothetical protein
VDCVGENLPYNLDSKTVILYQDKAPCHAAGSVQAFFEDAIPCLPRFVQNADIPPNSPDLNPLDYCACSILKAFE